MEEVQEIKDQCTKSFDKKLTSLKRGWVASIRSGLNLGFYSTQNNLLLED